MWCYLDIKNDASDDCFLCVRTWIKSCTINDVFYTIKAKRAALWFLAAATTSQMMAFHLSLTSVLLKISAGENNCQMPGCCTQSRFVCCFYPVLFLPFSTPVSTGSGSCRASRSPCFAVSMPFCASLPEKAPLWLCRNPDFSLRPRSTSYFSLKLSLAVTVTAHTHILFF